MACGVKLALDKVAQRLTVRVGYAEVSRWRRGDAAGIDARNLERCRGVAAIAHVSHFDIGLSKHS